MPFDKFRKNLLDDVESLQKNHRPVPGQKRQKSDFLRSQSKNSKKGN